MGSVMHALSILMNSFICIERKKKTLLFCVCLFNILRFIVYRNFLIIALKNIFSNYVPWQSQLVASARSRAKGSSSRHRSPALRLGILDDKAKSVPHTAGLCEFFQESDNGRAAYDCSLLGASLASTYARNVLRRDIAIKWKIYKYFAWNTSSMFSWKTTHVLESTRISRTRRLMYKASPTIHYRSCNRILFGHLNFSEFHFSRILIRDPFNVDELKNNFSRETFRYFLKRPVQRRYEKQFTVLSRRRVRTRTNAHRDFASPFRALDSTIDELCDLALIWLAQNPPVVSI